MIGARNRMSHTYSEADAVRIFAEIRDRYLPQVESILAVIGRRVK